MNSFLGLGGMLLALSLAAGNVAAAGDPHAHQHHSMSMPMSEQLADWGEPGEPQAVSRTVHVRMNDAMRFVPDTLEVREGETLRLVLTNEGALMHEWVLGTSKSLADHAVQMRENPSGAHDMPAMVHVKPGETGELVWRFSRAGTFDFACLVPGHFEAGMRGAVSVSP